MKSEGQAHVQTNVQADVQTLLGPITESEESLLSSVSFIVFSFSILPFPLQEASEVDLDGFLTFPCCTFFLGHAACNYAF